MASVTHCGQCQALVPLKEAAHLRACQVTRFMSVLCHHINHASMVQARHLQPPAQLHGSAAACQVLICIRRPLHRMS